MTIIYRKENGYGIINIMASEYQVGRRLYETQVELSKALSDRTPDPSKLEQIAHWYCELVAHVGQLKADYSSLQEVLRGRAEYHYREGNVEYKVCRVIDRVYT